MIDLIWIILVIFGVFQIGTIFMLLKRYFQRKNNPNLSNEYIMGLVWKIHSNSLLLFLIGVGMIMCKYFDKG